jgi:hypothetical protein
METDMFPRPNFGRAFVLALVLVAVASRSARADAPTINNISPLGVQRGVETDLTVSGANLTGNPQIVAPFPMIATPQPNSDGGTLRLKLAVSPSMAVGIYTIRVKTDDGVSNPFLFAVGQVPQVAEKEDNSTFESAQVVPSPVVVEGALSGNDVDFFKFSGKKGQRVVVDAQCARLGSGVDPQIRLTTAARSFIAAADDTPGLVTDARLTTILPEDTDYVVEISDTKYQGANRPVYRLVIGPVLVADEIYPLGGRRGDTVGFEVRGGTLPEPHIAAGTVLPSLETEVFRLQVTNHNLGVAGPGDPIQELEILTPLDVSDLAEVREPVDPNAPPTKAAAPVVLNGRIDPAGDEDRFVIAVTPGQNYRIRVDAARLGSALDGTMQILDAKGGTVAQADDTTLPGLPIRGQNQNPQGIISPDPSLNYSVPAGQTEITIALRDLDRRGGMGFPYRITVEPVIAGFQLSVAESQFSIPKGGTTAVAVTATRRGYNGSITVSATNLPPGVTCRPGTIPDGQAVGSFTLSAAPDANFGVSDIKIVGSGQSPAGPISIVGLKQVVFSQQQNFPTNLMMLNALAVAPALARPVSIEAPGDAVELVHGIGGPITLKVKREEKAEGALAVTALPASAGLAVPAGKIGDKDTEGTITVNVDPAAPLGLASVALIAKGKIGGKDVTLGIPEVALNIVRPAALELAAASVEIKAGASTEVKGKVSRKGPFKEPIKVSINGLPGGLKAEPVTVAPDASEFTITINADGGAAAAMANANVAMAFQINKKDYATPPTTLAVKVIK